MLEWLRRKGASHQDRQSGVPNQSDSAARFSTLLGIAESLSIELPKDRSTDIQRMSCVAAFAPKFIELAAAVAGWQTDSASGSARMALELAIFPVCDATCQCVGMQFELVVMAAHMRLAPKELWTFDQPEKMAAEHAARFGLIRLIHSNAMKQTLLGDLLIGLGRATYEFLGRPSPAKLAVVSESLVALRDAIAGNTKNA